jgi:hypothetical protein
MPLPDLTEDIVYDQLRTVLADHAHIPPDQILLTDSFNALVGDPAYKGQLGFNLVQKMRVRLTGPLGAILLLRSPSIVTVGDAVTHAHRVLRHTGQRIRKIMAS